MKTNRKSQPEEPQEQATNKGVSSELSQEIVIAIADYLDVFIEIDLETKQSKQGEENGTMSTSPNPKHPVSSHCVLVSVAA